MSASLDGLKESPAQIAARVFGKYIGPYIVLASRDITLQNQFDLDAQPRQMCRESTILKVHGDVPPDHIQMFKRANGYNRSGTEPSVEWHRVKVR
jgi:hypothetical protein